MEPTETTITQAVPVSSLYPDRYGVGKTMIYRWLNELKISPTKENKYSFITLDEVQLLDGYFRAIQESTEAAKKYLSERVHERDREHVQTIDQASGELVNAPVNMTLNTFTDATTEDDAIVTSPSWTLAIEALAARLSPTLADPLAPQRQLQEIADRGWQVSSRQVHQIMGVYPTDGMERYGFRIVRAGKAGRQITWKVEQITEESGVPD